MEFQSMLSPGGTQPTVLRSLDRKNGAWAYDDHPQTYMNGFRVYDLDRRRADWWRLQFQSTLGTAQGVSLIEVYDFDDARVLKTVRHSYRMGKTGDTRCIRERENAIAITVLRWVLSNTCMSNKALREWWCVSPHLVLDLQSFLTGFQCPNLIMNFRPLRILVSHVLQLHPGPCRPITVKQECIDGSEVIAHRPRTSAIKPILDSIKQVEKLRFGCLLHCVHACLVRSESPRAYVSDVISRASSLQLR